MPTKPTTDLGDLFLPMLYLLMSGKQPSAQGSREAGQLMQKQHRLLENQTLEQQRNQANEDRTGGLQSWYGTTPMREGKTTLGDIWQSEAEQKRQMDDLGWQIAKLLGRPR
ncbi:MAG: hypothetical protein RLZZ373_2960 [Pseudomonadota bacterium]|jgi:hypothetical protein